MRECASWQCDHMIGYPTLNTVVLLASTHSASARVSKGSSDKLLSNGSPTSVCLVQSGSSDVGAGLSKESAQKAEETLKTL